MFAGTITPEPGEVSADELRARVCENQNVVRSRRAVAAGRNVREVLRRRPIQSIAAHPLKRSRQPGDAAIDDETDERGIGRAAADAGNRERENPDGRVVGSRDGQSGIAIPAQICRRKTCGRIRRQSAHAQIHAPSEIVVRGNCHGERRVAARHDNLRSGRRGDGKWICRAGG